MTDPYPAADPDTSHVSAEIRRQPQAWTRAVGLADDLTGRLPAPGERAAIIGCGTSWYVAAAYAALREASGHGETDAFAASQLPAGRRYDRVVAISRSGTTTEVIRAIDRSPVPVTAITAVAGSPVAEGAAECVLLDFADERSVVQTVFATTTLMLLRAGLGSTGLDRTIAQAEAVLAGAHPLPDGVDSAGQVSFLGQDWAFGIAQEAALKLREASQSWTEAYLQMEYRHGPIAIAQPGRAVWVFGTPVEGIEDDVDRTGATLVAGRLDPVADLVRAQLLAVRRAHRDGLDPDRPRSLTRSVVLSA